jgi:high affinity sulfate transporter 1
MEPELSMAAKPFLTRMAPGLAGLRHYDRNDLPHDLVAGLSVAAIAVPVGVAYAQLAGFSPAIGLYASILPLFAYAIFGTSRQLIVGPDAATCALVATALAPIAAGDQQLYLSLSISLAFLTGILCIVARFLKLGAVAEFLSKPILVGFLNGVALSIFLGQIGNVLGFAMTGHGIVPRLVELALKLEQVHLETLGVGAGTFLILWLSPKLLPRAPAVLIAMILAALATKLLGLDLRGVATVGHVRAGLPALGLPSFPAHLLPQLIADAAGLALVTFSSMMLTAHSFASKNRYEIDSDQEFAALGAANIASALGQGFAVSGADSRTAMSDSMGGRTQLTGVVAAISVALVVLFFAGSLEYVPVAALGAVLVKAALSLVDVAGLRMLFKLDRQEFALSVMATLGVVAVGAVQAILVAVVLATVRFVKLMSRPPAEILGELPGLPGFHCIARHPGASTIPGLCLLRFNAPIVFFNARYFKREALAAVSRNTSPVAWLIIDLIPVPLIDATGVFTVREVIEELQARGIQLVAAGRQTEWFEWAEKRQIRLQPDELIFYPSIDAAIEAFRCESNMEAGRRTTTAGKAT